MQRPIVAAFGVLALLLGGCVSGIRPAGPPEGERFRVPAGAISIQSDRAAGNDLGRNLNQALDRRFAGVLARDADGFPVFRVLALSGGGSRGAYGAGVLLGWTEQGTRPQFDIVTGVSTGGLMATFAFLGPEYDDRLRAYTEIDSDDIYVTRNAVTGVFTDALRDTAPLRALIARQIDDSVLKAVAEQHAAGRRLFVGTTNLDAATFIMWDLGWIAASDRPDKLQLYRDVVLASASFPMLFPPVYIPIEVDGVTHWQMHVDGSARSNVFAAAFMLDLDGAIERAELGSEEVHRELWVVHNGQAPDAINKPVAPKVIDIAEAAIHNLLETSSRSGISELYSMAMLNGFSFSYTAIPADTQIGADALNFDREEMNHLFDIGFETGQSGDGWLVQPPPAEPFELLRLLDPEVLRASGGRFPQIPFRPPRWLSNRATVSKAATIRLCTGSVAGNYHRLGALLQKRLAPFGLSAQLVQTEGSFENLQRVDDGSCDAAFTQHDAYLLDRYDTLDELDLRPVLRPKYLFDEYVHLVCNRTADVRRLADLLDDPTRHLVLLGESGGGSAVSWEVLKLLDASYGAVPTAFADGDGGLTLLLEETRPACLLYVGSLNSPFMDHVDANGATLRLLAIADPGVSNARVKGEKIYQFDRFPIGTYPTLQANLERPDLAGVTVGTSLIIARDWAGSNRAGYSVLLNVVSGMRREFAEAGGMALFSRSAQ